MRTRSGPIGVNGDSENRIDNEIERRENQESIDTNVTSTKKTRKNTNDKKKIVRVTQKGKGNTNIVESKVDNKNRKNKNKQEKDMKEIDSLMSATNNMNNMNNNSNEDIIINCQMKSNETLSESKVKETRSLKDLFEAKSDELLMLLEEPERFLVLNNSKNIFQNPSNASLHEELLSMLKIYYDLARRKQVLDRDSSALNFLPILGMDLESLWALLQLRDETLCPLLTKACDKLSSKNDFLLHSKLAINGRYEEDEILQDDDIGFEDSSEDDQETDSTESDSTFDEESQETKKDFQEGDDNFEREQENENDEDNEDDDDDNSNGLNQEIASDDEEEQYLESILNQHIEKQNKKERKIESSRNEDKKKDEKNKVRPKEVRTWTDLEDGAFKWDEFNALPDNEEEDEFLEEVQEAIDTITDENSDADNENESFKDTEELIDHEDSDGEGQSSVNEYTDDEEEEDEEDQEVLQDFDDMEEEEEEEECNDNKGYDSVETDEEDENSYDGEMGKYDNEFGQNLSEEDFHKFYENEQEEQDGGDYENDEMVEASNFQKQQFKKRREIAEIEEELIQGKGWSMKGETSANERPENSLLEGSYDVDRASRPLPQLTEDHTQSIEDLIKTRILHQKFDDVIPKTLVEEVLMNANKRRRLNEKDLPEVSQEKSKKGLGEIYEEEYLSMVIGVEKESEESKVKMDLIRSFKKLMYKLDTLTNFHYTPKPYKNKDGKEEMKITSDIPAIMMEEIIPLTMASEEGKTANEIFEKKRGRDGIVRTTQEMDKEERKRARQRSKATRNKTRKTKTARLNMLTQDVTQQDKDGEKAYASAVRSGKVQIVESNKNPSFSSSTGKASKAPSTTGHGGTLINSGKTKVSSSTFFSALQRELNENDGQYSKTKANNGTGNFTNTRNATGTSKGILYKL